MQRLVRLPLLWALLVPRTASSQSQLHQVLLLRVAVDQALVDDLLHVAPLRSDDLSGHLELLVVVDLHVVAAGELLRRVRKVCDFRQVLRGRELDLNSMALSYLDYDIQFLYLMPVQQLVHYVGVE